MLSSNGAVELDGDAIVALTATFTVDGSVLAREVEFVMLVAFFIFLIYWVHTMGELMVSPVGLSAVTKLAPARIVGMTMGAWFLYSGLSNFLAGVIARTTGAETIGGQMTNVGAAKAGYIEVYTQVGFIAIGIAVLMLLISPVISKMMHGAD